RLPALPASPRQANSVFRALSIHGGLTVTSKQRFSRFIYSRQPHRDKQTAVFTLYLFTAASPRQANSVFRALSIHGSLTVTSKQQFSRLIYSRQPHRDKQTAVFTLFLFIDPSPGQTSNSFHAFCIHCSLTRRRHEQLSRYLSSRQRHSKRET